MTVSVQLGQYVGIRKCYLCGVWILSRSAGIGVFPVDWSLVDGYWISVSSSVARLFLESCTPYSIHVV